MRVLDVLDRLSRVEGNAGEVHVSNDLSRLLNLTDKLAQQRQDQYISSELFLLAALEDKGALGDALRAARASTDEAPKPPRWVRSPSRSSRSTSHPSAAT